MWSELSNCLEMTPSRFARSDRFSWVPRFRVGPDRFHLTPRRAGGPWQRETDPRGAQGGHGARTCNWASCVAVDARTMQPDSTPVARRPSLYRD